MATESAQALSQFFSSANGAIAVATASLTALLALIAGVYKFRHEQFRKLPLEHFKLLQEAAQGDELMAGGLRTAARLEVYRQTFGASGTPATARAMFELLNSGKFSVQELRAAAPYARDDAGKLAIEPGWVSGVLFWLYMAAFGLVLYMTASLVFALFGTSTVLGSLLGLGVEIAGLLVAVFFVKQLTSEWLAKDTARRVREALRDPRTGPIPAKISDGLDERTRANPPVGVSQESERDPVS